jgi:hypothetical protein
MGAMLRAVTTGFCVLVLACACSTTTTPAVVPTQTLIVPTATDTPISVTATVTSTPLPHPGDIATTTPSAVASVDSPEAQITTTLASDPVAAELVALAQRRVAQDLNLPTRRIRLIEVKAFIWSDISLGCPEPDQTYAVGDIDGYRIVLEVGDVQYIFHTDFDRVIPCDPANEKLPL